MPPPDWLSEFLNKFGSEISATPINIVDIGASGAPPENQACLASVSTYLGFDPDLRIPQTGNAFGFRKHVVLAHAVTSENVPKVVFTLTKFPQCSSVLKPDLKATHCYSIGDFFTPEREQSVNATTLNQALEHSNISAIDWLKLDTQGTDLSILKSLETEKAKRLLVVELEPGITPFYFGEDRLAETHEYMLSQGFWLADLNQQKFPRISVKTIDEVGLTSADVERLNGNPFAAELQYFRTTESMLANNCDVRDFLVVWLIAMANSQFAFAIEVAHQAIQVGLSTNFSRELTRISIDQSFARSEPRKESSIARVARLLIPPIIPKLIGKLRYPFKSRPN